MHFILVQTACRTQNRSVPLSFLLEVDSTMQGYLSECHIFLQIISKLLLQIHQEGSDERECQYCTLTLKYHLHGSLGFVAVLSVLPAVGTCTMVWFRSLDKQELGMWGSYATLIYKEAVCLVRAENA